MENFILIGLFVALGVFSRRLEAFPAQTSQVLNMFALYVSLPAPWQLLRGCWLSWRPPGQSRDPAGVCDPAIVVRSVVIQARRFSLHGLDNCADAEHDAPPVASPAGRFLLLRSR